jgi:hypothetical protein
MATRGIIAERTASGWQGRYCHWDNYPKRIVGVLKQLVNRDGLSKVTQVLIRETASWSQVEPMATKGVPSLYEERALVEGYGYAHTDVSVTDDSTMFRETDTDFAWCEWLYLIDDTGVEVRSISADGVISFHAHHSW